MIPSRWRRIAVAAALVAAWLVVSDKLEVARIATPLPSATAATALAPLLDQARLLDDVRVLASPEFAGRQTGTDGSRKAQAFLKARFAALGLQYFGDGYAHPFVFTRTSVKGVVTSHPDATNYIGFIPGSKNPERFLVISAHYDHLGIRDGKLYPGADDNASGVAAMLAMAAWFKAHPPLHSVVFAAFDGEELGLRGARAFLAALPFPKSQLAMNFNLDMVSHNDNNEIFAAGTSYTPVLTPLVRQVAARSTVNVKLGHDRSQLTPGAGEDWTGSSDHGPFHEAGVPFLYFGVEDHADYHQPGDTFEHLNQEFYVKVASLLADMAATLDKHLDTIVAR